MHDLSSKTSQAPGGRLRLASGISSSESDIGSKPPSAKALSCNGHASRSAAERLPKHYTADAAAARPISCRHHSRHNHGTSSADSCSLSSTGNRLYTLEQTLVVEATSGREGLAAGFPPAALLGPPLLGLLAPPDLSAPPGAGLLGPAALLPSADEGLLLPEAGRALGGWADAATALHPLPPSPPASLGLLLAPAVAPEPCFCTFLGGARKSSSS